MLSWCVDLQAQSMSTAQTPGPIDIYARLSRKGDKEQRSTSGQAS